MRSKEGRFAAAALAAVLFMAAGAAQAAGLRTAFGEVVVKNLKIGQTYSLSSLINFPLRILNTGNETAELKVDVTTVSPAAVKAGYEQLPDLSWVKLEKQEFTVDPNHEAVTDVIVSIPNDPKLLGRRFQADIWTRTFPHSQMMAVGLDSRLLIQVSSIPPTPDELKKKFVDKHLANLDFTLYPTVGVATDVPMGVDFDLKKERGLAIKIVNPNDNDLHFRIRSVPNWEALLYVPPGYEEAYDARWLRPEKEVVTIPGNSIKQTALILHIPQDDRYAGKAFFFPVSAEILEQEIPARVFYKLMVVVRSKEDRKPR